MLESLNSVIDGVFGPPLRWFFGNVNAVLDTVYMPTARIVAVGFFIVTMIWVYFGLRKDYVNLEAPSKHFWADLRLWTIVSMLPHIIVYFYF
jgi:hypothetical protein